jgi:threonine aldolase
MTDKISFGSDNCSGVCPEIMDYLNEINIGHVSGYGEDKYTERATHLFKEEFGSNIAVFFVYNGTGANTLSMAALTRSYHSIICSDIAHLNMHEVTAPQSLTGCKLIVLPNKNGKITVDQIRDVYEEGVFWGRHTALPKVVSITQPTEFGTLYSFEEITAIADFCHHHDMYLHMDGARISNACVAMDVPFSKISREAGVDVLSFGATKNGLMFGEAVVFFNTKLSEHFDYRQKQGLQLHSKMRFLAGQFIPYFEKGLWRKNASHANEMCKLLGNYLLKALPDCLVYKVETNLIYARMQKELTDKLHQEFYFYTFDPKEGIVRLVTDFETKLTDIEVFGNKLQEYL